VNILLIGFNGGGNGGISIAQEEARPWLEHIEHSLRHTIVGRKPAAGRTLHQVRYKFHFNVVDLGPAVTDVVERAILHHMRPEDPAVDGYFKVADAKLYPEPKNATFQVDPAKITNVLEHLIHSFRFNHSYSIVLMNPKRHLTHEGIYGYRAGFSNGEIALLRKDHTLLTKRPRFEPDSEPRYFDGDFAPLPDRGASAAAAGGADGKRHTISAADAAGAASEEDFVQERADLYSPIQWKRYVDRAEEWALSYLSRWKQRPLHASEYPDDVKTLHFSGTEGLENLIQQTLHKGTPHDLDHLHELETNAHLHEDCIVDAWVSSTRTAFIDLSAGPAAWGPIVSGEGVKTESTFPSVSQLLSSLERAAKV
jgi:hypothetical protein